MITKEEVKQKAYGFGAEAFGFASTASFSNAPDGFKPQDIYEPSKSVLVFLKSMPIDLPNLMQPEPYSNTALTIYSEIDKLAIDLSRWLSSFGIGTVPIPCDVPYSYWESNKSYGRGLLSLRHAARNAGLGILGKNTLLLNQEFGNMVYIGAILTDEQFSSDPINSDFGCPEECRICIDACPQGALDGETVNQKLCREVCTTKVGRGFEIYTCNECRKVCPKGSGKMKTKR